MTGSMLFSSQFHLLKLHDEITWTCFKAHLVNLSKKCVLSNRGVYILEYTLGLDVLPSFQNTYHFEFSKYIPTTMYLYI
jgi:hypothetical protein